MKELRIYSDLNGKIPFNEWLNSIKDKVTKARIRARLDRLVLGCLGDYKTIANGIYELRLHFGSGYRIYFSFFDDVIVILLCGGDKSTQVRDIEKVKRYFQDLQERSHEEAQAFEEYS
ncbi:MAG: type II toxin-antitoxin system RelE/ParE family toxin [Proteobacteria bacterium]|nr:type II toxin-antitoxin system RelE/ParE family toxin [Pseudomonadota bacterium]